MAEKRLVNEDQEAPEFELVSQTYTSLSQTRRKSPGADISRTGYGETNTNGTGEFERLIVLLGGTMENQWQMKFGANEAKGLVAGYMAIPGEAGATTVKRSKDKKVVTFHLGHIFDKYPSLRPAGELFCTLKYGRDKQGTPCIILNLRGTAVRKGRSTGEASGTAGAQQK